MNSDEKICPRCAETVKRAAVVCRYCNYEFGQDSPLARAMAQHQSLTKEEQAKNTRSSLLGCLAIVIVVALIGQCASSGGDSESNSIDDANLTSTSAAEPINLSEQPTAPASDWSVSTRQDELRGKPEHYAAVTSENEVYFEFPYAGGSRLTMTVRRHPKYGDDVVFQISDGQFICGIYDCKGSISFGKDAETLTLATPEDHDSKTLFAKYGPAIIRKLKSSDRVIVELPFYQEGNRQFTFKTHGLVWPPKS